MLYLHLGWLCLLYYTFGVDLYYILVGYDIWTSSALCRVNFNPRTTKLFSVTNLPKGGGGYFGP